MPLHCSAMKFREVNSDPKGKIGVLMLHRAWAGLAAGCAGTARPVPVADSLCNSGHGNVPACVCREGRCSKTPGVSTLLGCWLHFSAAASGETTLCPLQIKRNRINIFIFLTCCLNQWFSDYSVVILDQSYSPQKAFQVFKYKIRKCTESWEVLGRLKRERDSFLIIPKYHMLERYWLL